MVYIYVRSMSRQTLVPSTCWLDTERIHDFGFEILPPRALIARDQFLDDPERQSGQHNDQGEKGLERRANKRHQEEEKTQECEHDGDDCPYSERSLQVGFMVPEIQQSKNTGQVAKINKNREFNARQ